MTVDWALGVLGALLAANVAVNTGVFFRLGGLTATADMLISSVRDLRARVVKLEILTGGKIHDPTFDAARNAADAAARRMPDHR